MQKKKFISGYFNFAAPKFFFDKLVIIVNETKQIFFSQSKNRFFRAFYFAVDRKYCFSRHCNFAVFRPRPRNFHAAKFLSNKVFFKKVFSLLIQGRNKLNIINKIKLNYFMIFLNFNSFLWCFCLVCNSLSVLSRV